MMRGREQGRQQYRKTIRHYDEPFVAHEFTFSCYKKRAFLSRDRTREYLAEAIDRAREKHSFHLWAYVFMPEHVHLIIWPRNKCYSTSSILKSVKLPVAKGALAFVRRAKAESLELFATGEKRNPYRFWQAGPGYDRNISSISTLREMIDYIHENPVRRELVSAPEDWKWSSARAWADVEDGPIAIDRETFPGG